MTPKGGNLA